MSFQGDEYGKRTLDFVQRLQKLTSYDDICRHVVTELEWFGFTHVSSISLPGPGREATECILMNTRPREYIVEGGKVHVGAAHNRNKGLLGHHFASGDSARGLYKNPAREPHKLSIARGIVSPLASSEGNAARFSGMALTGSLSVSTSSDSHSMRKQHHAPRS